MERDLQIIHKAGALCFSDVSMFSSNTPSLTHPRETGKAEAEMWISTSIGHRHRRECDNL